MDTPEIHLDLVKCDCYGHPYKLRVWCNLQGAVAPFTDKDRGESFGNALSHVLASAGFITVKSGLLTGEPPDPDIPESL